MRHSIENVLGEQYRYLAIQTRERLHLTQKEMGERLYMSESSYSDIETGVTGCVGTLTATRLLHMQENPMVFLEQAEQRIADLFEKELAFIWH